MSTNPTHAHYTLIPTDNSYFENLRATEFSRLDRGGHAYLDFTGGGLHARGQFRKYQALLENDVLGNPHSINPTSALAGNWATKTRRRVLDFFNAGDDYYCVFTSGASAALKLVGECFPWAPGSHYALAADNHNSVHGIREYCAAKGGSTSYLPLQSDDLRLQQGALTRVLSGRVGGAPSLCAVPAQSNVTGVKHDREWIGQAKDAGWYTLLDAAAYVPTNRLDLQVTRPDFVALSFYKMFGLPTGLGCLLVHKETFPLLRKPWFAGGTVRIASVANGRHILHDDHERFEDGTIDYASLPAVYFGLDFLESVGMDRIRARVESLAKYCVQELGRLHHANGSPLVRLLACPRRTGCGGTISMVLFNENEERMELETIDRHLAAAGISARTGCFCNPGVDELVSQLTADKIAAGFAGDKSGRGALRVSFGVPTILGDVERLVASLGTLLS